LLAAFAPEVVLLALSLAAIRLELSLLRPRGAAVTTPSLQTFTLAD